MKFVDDVKNCYKWFSMKVFAVLAIVPVVWVGLPSDVKDMIPESWNKWMFLALAGTAVIGGIGRTIKQDIPK